MQQKQQQRNRTTSDSVFSTIPTIALGKMPITTEMTPVYLRKGPRANPLVRLRKSRHTGSALEQLLMRVRPPGGGGAGGGGTRGGGGGQAAERAPTPNATQRETHPGQQKHPKQNKRQAQPRTRTRKRKRKQKGGRKRKHKRARTRTHTRTHTHTNTQDTHTNTKSKKCKYERLSKIGSQLQVY